MVGVLSFSKTIFKKIIMKFLTITLALILLTGAVIFAENVKVGIIVADKLNMRSGPNTNTTSLKILKRGTKVSVLKDLGLWLMIEIWLLASYFYFLLLVLLL